MAISLETNAVVVKRVHCIFDIQYSEQEVTKIVILVKKKIAENLTCVSVSSPLKALKSYLAIQQILKSKMTFNFIVGEISCCWYHHKA